MRFRIPDWTIYFLIVFLIYFNAARNSPEIDSSTPPPELGPMLPGQSPRDTTVLVEMDAPSSGIGTAFAVDNKGTWLTARHVIDSCDSVGLKLGGGKVIKTKPAISQRADIGVLKTKWKREPIASDLYTQRQVGEQAYLMGFPQGRPGEVIGQLLGRHRLLVRGRYSTEEAILAWSEVGRTRGLKGSIGGMSGGPVLDKDGEIIGIVAAESPRRGRVYTVAPSSLRSVIPDGVKTKAIAISNASYGLEADRYRRDRRIAQVICIVE
jgi:S1-C subfamily serine protease